MPKLRCPSLLGPATICVLENVSLKSQAGTLVGLLLKSSVLGLFVPMFVLDSRLQCCGSVSDDRHLPLLARSGALYFVHELYPSSRCRNIWQSLSHEECMY
jgi:hypothetical protein